MMIYIRDDTIIDTRSTTVRLIYKIHEIYENCNVK